MPNRDRFDCIIIGAGAAGISCALELHDVGINYVVLEKGHQIGFNLTAITNSIKNFSGGYFENGDALRLSMAAVVEHLGCNYRLKQDVESINLDTRIVKTGGGEFEGRTILLSTGYRRRRLELSGEDKYDADISYDIALLQPGHFKDQIVAVIGGGDSAVLDALELADAAQQIHLIHRSSTLTARPDILKALKSAANVQVLLDTRVTALSGDAGLQSLALQTNERTAYLQVDKLVVKIGFAPNTQLLEGQLRMDEKGHIFIDEHCRSSVPDVFAAGDIVAAGYPRLAVAVGQGMIAAAAIRKIIEGQ